LTFYLAAIIIFSKEVGLYRLTFLSQGGVLASFFIN